MKRWIQVKRSIGLVGRGGRRRGERGCLALASHYHRQRPAALRTQHDRWRSPNFCVDTTRCYPCTGVRPRRAGKESKKVKNEEEAANCKTATRSRAEVGSHVRVRSRSPLRIRRSALWVSNLLIVRFHQFVVSESLLLLSLNLWTQTSTPDNAISPT